MGRRPSLRLDATYVKMREGGRIVSRAVMIAMMACAIIAADRSTVRSRCAMEAGGLAMPTCAPGYGSWPISGDGMDIAGCMSSCARRVSA